MAEDDVYADIDVADDGVDEASPPEDEIEDNPDLEEQNLPEGEEAPDDPELHPDLPDTDDDEFVAELKKGAEDDA